MRSILLVPRLANNGSNCRSGLAYAYSMIACLSGSADLTILTPREINPTETKAFLKKYFEAPVNVVSLSEIDAYSNRPLESRLEDHKPFVNESFRVLELINKVNYDCVVFDVFGAAGFIPTRSKRTGTALANTQLVSWLWNCHEFQRLQRLEPPKYPNCFTEDLEIDFAEQYCLRFCDFAISHSEAILEWVAKKGWFVDMGRIVKMSNIRSRPLNEWLPENKPPRPMAVDPKSHDQASDGTLISICVAHYNDARNLSHLIHSIKKNDYDKFELIIVDDCSTDPESIAMFDSLAKEHGSDTCRFIKKELNESLGPTRNAAVREARGEFIFFADSDDLLSGTIISDVVNGMLRSGVDCLTCPLVFFHGDGAECKESAIFKFWLPLGGCVELGFYENPFGGANFCIKKSVYEALGGFKGQSGEVHEDWEFLARLVIAGYELDVLPKAGYFYRVRAGSWLQSARSGASVYNLRKRILRATGPVNMRLVNDLLLRVSSENDRMRSTAWKLDRKITKLALRLVDVIPEKHRVILDNKIIKTVSRVEGLLTKARDATKLLAGKFKLQRAIPETPAAPLADYIKQSGNLVTLRPISDRLEQWERMGLPADRPIFGALGENRNEDGVAGFLRLCYWMRILADESFFVMSDNPTTSEATRSLTQKYALTNFKWISAHQCAENIPALLSGFLITSREEDLRKEMFHALISGVPVFSTDNSSIRDILDEYCNGIMVSHGPNHRDFADCFIFWKNNIEIYKTAAADAAKMIRTAGD